MCNERQRRLAAATERAVEAVTARTRLEGTEPPEQARYLDPRCVEAAKTSCSAERLSLESSGEYSQEELDTWETNCVVAATRACEGSSE